MHSTTLWATSVQVEEALTVSTVALRPDLGALHVVGEHV